MTYREILERLVAARRFGMKLGLSRMRELLDRLGVPDRRLGTVVHVAGTNGKGSTVAMIAALASAAGKRVATYTSPHLSTLCERIVIGDPSGSGMASEEAIVASAARVEAAGGGELTFFEQVTAIAMLIIADAGVDLTVLEVGLGGRLDATNVVDAPIAVVTGVAKDHEAILGDTLEAIAHEKAGIFKPGQRAVVGASGERGAVPVLVEDARSAGVAEVIVIDEAAIARVPPLTGLRGAHQRANAAAAIAVADLLGLACDRAAVLAHVRHPGRFEVAGDLILDGAHNPHGARALAATLSERGLRPVLVIAVSSDKDARGIAAALTPVVRAVIATRYQQERALDPQALARAFVGVPVQTAPDLAAALEVARSFGPPILVAGSLFLVGEARVLCLGAPADPIVATESLRPG
jgi:dihydrofolate synthase/folylpolyglutamate synthase